MSWNRWTKRVLGGALALSTLGGCRQQLWMEPSDYHDAVRYGLPKALEASPQEAILPPTVDRIGPGPATVFDPARPPRYVALKECVAIALEQGNVGSQSPTQPGAKNENIQTAIGQAVSGTDAIRAYALDPANTASDIERSLSKFDARWITSMSWQKLDNPTPNGVFAFQNQQDQATFSTTLAKPLPTGGTAGVTFSTAYSKFPSSINQGNFGSFLNPNYIPQLQFIFEQPLAQLFGVEVNQLTGSHPSSLLISGLQPSGGQGVEGILITRIRLDQVKANFETQVNFLLLNVEGAYWNLYNAYYSLYAQEEGLRQSFDGYRFTAARVDAGQDPPQNLQQARAQFELFRGNVYRARGQVLEAERQLRGMMGLRSDENSRLVPIDEPNLAQYRPDFYESANEAIAFRPELMIARQDLKARQLNLILAKNLRRPDIRAFSSYNIQGIGNRLDGSEFASTPTGGTINGNAFTSLQANQFNSWQLGLRADIPLGFRDANAQVRQAQLNLTKSYYQLRDVELKTVEFLVAQHRRVYETHSLIAPAKSRREALQIYVYKVKQLIDVGKWDSTTFFNFLQVQRDLAQSIADEFTAISNYNIALAQLEFAKGTIMRYNNVNLAEGQLPDHVAKRAAEQVRERTEGALKLREREGFNAPPAEPRTIGPATGNPLALPPLTDPRPPVPDELPTPRTVDPSGAAPAPSPIPGPTTDPLPTPATPMTPAPGPTVMTRPWPDSPAAVEVTPVPQPQPAIEPMAAVEPVAPPVTMSTAPQSAVPADAATSYFEPRGRVSLSPAPPVPPAPATTATTPATAPSGPVFAPPGTIAPTPVAAPAAPATPPTMSGLPPGVIMRNW